MNKLNRNPKKIGFMVIGHPTKALNLLEVLKLNNSDIKRVNETMSLVVKVGEKSNLEE